MLLKFFRLLVTNYQESGDLVSLGQGCQHSEWSAVIFKGLPFHESLDCPINEDGDITFTPNSGNHSTNDTALPPHFSPTLLRAPEIMASYLRRLVNLQMYNTSDIWWDSSVNFTNDLGCHNKLLTPAFYWEDCQEWPLNKYDKWNKWSVPQTRRFVSHLVACTREELMMECNVCYQYHQYASNLMVNKAN
jgi:hypothetical protein